MKKQERLPVGAYYINYFSNGSFNVMKTIGDEDFLGYVVLYRSDKENPHNLDNKFVTRHINETAILRMLFDDN